MRQKAYALLAEMLRATYECKSRKIGPDKIRTHRLENSDYLRDKGALSDKVCRERDSSFTRSQHIS